MVKPHG